MWQDGVMAVRPLKSVAVFGVSGAALLNLPQPFGSDQALFSVYAGKMAEGATYLKDV